MYKLVLISLIFNTSSQDIEPFVEGWWTYDSLFECFHARDALGQEASGKPGYFPQGMQAVCIPHPA